MAKKKPVESPLVRIEKKLDELEKKLFKYADDTNSDFENVLTILGKIGTKVFGTDDEAEEPTVTRDCVLRLVPRKTKLKKHLPILYYEGMLRLPNGKNKAKWTKDLEDAATDSHDGLSELVEELEPGTDVPTDYKTNVVPYNEAVSDEEEC